MTEQPNPAMLRLVDTDDDLMTVEEFIANCKSGGFIDYDGYGHPVVDGKQALNIDVVPSRLGEIPTWATHINWFNR